MGGGQWSIIFLNEKMNIKCVDNDCLSHASYHFATLLILQFILNIKEVVQPIISNYIERKKQSNRLKVLR